MRKLACRLVNEGKSVREIAVSVCNAAIDRLSEMTAELRFLFVAPGPPMFRCCQ
jgi:hypothetical protein